MTIRVLVADDEPLVRAGIAMLLTGHDDVAVVGEASNGAEAVEIARTLQPDVIIMDIRMPVLDGIAATRKLVAAGAGRAPGSLPERGVAVLALTAFDSDTYVRQMLLAGAVGFVLKHAVGSELLTAVRAAAAGNAWLDPAVTRYVIDQLVSRPGLPPGTTPDLLDQLTAREREVLTLISEGLSNGEIADRFMVTEATVKTHVSRVLMKLQVRDRTQAAVLAYQRYLTDQRRGAGGRRRTGGFVLEHSGNGQCF